MFGFSPIKKRANKFTYVPRFYDPEKEAREQRRAEMYGTRSDDDAEYSPGRYIRTQREARTERYSERVRKNEMRIWKMVGGMVVMALIIGVLYPKIIGIISNVAEGAATQAVVQDTVKRVDSFDQRGISDVEWSEMPLRVVPND